jgi:hypothetical protein
MRRTRDGLWDRLASSERELSEAASGLKAVIVSKRLDVSRLLRLRPDVDRERRGRRLLTRSRR